MKRKKIIKKNTGLSNTSDIVSGNFVCIKKGYNMIETMNANNFEIVQNDIVLSKRD